jgi:hypothetical protein
MTTASLIVVKQITFACAPPALSDSMGNTYTSLTAYSNGTDRIRLSYFIPTSTSQLSSSMTWTLAAPGAGCYNSILIAGYVGTQATTAFRSGTDTGNGGGSNLSVTPVAANDLVLTAEASDSATAPTITAGFTIIDQMTTTANGATGADAWQIAPNTSAISFKWAGVTVFAQAGAAFEVGPAPGGSTVVASPIVTVLNQ